MDQLTKQDQEFVKEVAITGNATQAVKKAYKIKNDGTARVKGSKLLTKDNINTAIVEVKKTLAERIDIDKLEKVFNEGLGATRQISENVEVPDHSVRHKFFDSGVKIVGGYAPDKAININIDAEITNPKAVELAKKYEEELKKSL